MSEFTVKDSGQRQQYASGMVRDLQAGKLQYRRVFYGPLVERLAQHLTKGAQKYPDDADGTPNWLHAHSREELTRFYDSATRHFAQWLRGENEEDHFAAVVFNMNCAEYVKGRLGAPCPQKAQEPIPTPVYWRWLERGEIIPQGAIPLGVRTEITQDPRAFDNYRPTSIAGQPHEGQGAAEYLVPAQELPQTPPKPAVAVPAGWFLLAEDTPRNPKARHALLEKEVFKAGSKNLKAWCIASAKGRLNFNSFKTLYYIEELPF